MPRYRLFWESSVSVGLSAIEINPRQLVFFIVCSYTIIMSGTGAGQYKVFFKRQTFFVIFALFGAVFAHAYANINPAGLNGTWDFIDDYQTNTIIFNDGNFEMQFDGIPGVRGGYTVSGSNIAFEVAEFYDRFVEMVLEGMGLDLDFPEGWFNRTQLMDAFLNAFSDEIIAEFDLTLEEMGEIQEMMDEFREFLLDELDGLDEILGIMNFALDGNTLIIDDAVLTRRIP